MCSCCMAGDEPMVVWNPDLVVLVCARSHPTTPWYLLRLFRCSHTESFLRLAMAISGSCPRREVLATEAK